MVDSNKNYWLEHLAITGSGGLESRVAHRHARTGTRRNNPRGTAHESGWKGNPSERVQGQIRVSDLHLHPLPVPHPLPLLSNEFAAIRRELLKTPDVYRKTHLVSISLDPAYDTPPVLRKYGLGYVQNDAAGFAHWDFVATSPAELRELAAAFGLEYFEQGNQITHSMRTVLLAPDGP